MGGLFSMLTWGSGPKMCLNCGTTPAFQNRDYCGKTCAEWAKNPPAAGPPGWGQQPPTPAPWQGWGGYGSNYGPPPPAPPPQQQEGWGGSNQYTQQAPQAPGPMCQHCQMKPTSPGHPYCSKTCGTSAKQGAAPPMPPQRHGPPPAGYGVYGPQGGQWQQGPPTQVWQPQQQGGQWAGRPPQGGQGWSGPPQNWGQGEPPPRWNNRPKPGGYGDNDDDWADEEEEDDYEDVPRRPNRASVAKKGKMCIHCGDNPSYGKSEFCSKGCRAEADSRLRSSMGSGVGRRATIGGGSTRRGATDYEEFD